MITAPLKHLIVALAQSGSDSALVDGLAEAILGNMQRLVQAEETRNAAQAEATRAVLAKRAAEEENRRLAGLLMAIKRIALSCLLPTERQKVTGWRDAFLESDDQEPARSFRSLDPQLTAYLVGDHENLAAIARLLASNPLAPSPEIGDPGSTPSPSTPATTDQSR